MNDSIGVDFGTSTMLVSLNSRNSRTVDPTIPIGETTPWMPSVVGINETGDYLYGEEAERLPDKRKVYSIKTLLARDKTSVLVDGIHLDVDNAIVELIDLSLKRAQENSPIEKRALFSDRSNISLSCPAHWEANPRKRLSSIAKTLGINIKPDQIVDEPISAGISWIMGSKQVGNPIPNGKTLVFDFGGGTLDVAVIEVENPIILSPGSLSPEERIKQTTPTITVLSAYAIDKAGDNVDSLIAESLLSDLSNMGAIDDSPYDSDEVLELLKRAAKRLKEGLTDTEIASELVPGLGEIKLSRGELEKILQSEMHSIIRFVKPVLRSAAAREKDSNLSAIRSVSTSKLASDITQILLSGGMSRIPYIRKRLEEELKKPTIVDPYLKEPEKSVAAGLTYPETVSGINMHRPSCDFFVWYYDDKSNRISEEIIYEAFTPLYNYESSLLNILPQYKLDLSPPVDATTMGLVCKRPTGELIDINNNEPTPQLLVKVGRDSINKPNRFHLYLDGTILFSGAEVGKGRIERWPIIRDGLSLLFTPEKTTTKKDWAPNIHPFWDKNAFYEGP